MRGGLRAPHSERLDRRPRLHLQPPEAHRISQLPRRGPESWRPGSKEGGAADRFVLRGDGETPGGANASAFTGPGRRSGDP